MLVVDQLVLEPARDVVDERDDRHRDDDGSCARNGAHDGRLEGVAHGDVALDREGHGQPDGGRLRHEAERVHEGDHVGPDVQREAVGELVQTDEEERDAQHHGVPHGQRGQEAVGGRVHRPAGQHGDRQQVAHQPAADDDRRDHPAHVQTHRLLPLLLGRLEPAQVRGGGLGRGVGRVVERPLRGRELELDDFGEHADVERSHVNYHTSTPGLRNSASPTNTTQERDQITSLPHNFSPFPFYFVVVIHSSGNTAENKKQNMYFEDNSNTVKSVKLLKKIFILQIY